MPSFYITRIKNAKSGPKIRHFLFCGQIRKKSGNRVNHVSKLNRIIPQNEIKLCCEFQVLRIIVTEVIILSRL